jgi:hypothetical protein
MVYTAKLDRASKIITVVCCALITGIVVLSVNSLTKVPVGSFSFFKYLLIAVLLILVPVLCYLFSIKEYSLEGNTFKISRNLNSLAINIGEINEARLLTKHDMKGMIRTFGVGGLFGYFGRFYNNTLGSVYLYTTQQNNRILITTKKGLKIIVSPDNLQLLENLKQRIH